LPMVESAVTGRREAGRVEEAAIHVAPLRAGMAAD
jgi:hypothetical protein